MKPETKYKGSIKLSAIGDALGWITEFEKSKQSLKEKFGTERIETFHPWKKTVGGRFYGFIDSIKAGSYSDDTQLLLAVARSIKKDGSLDHNYFAKSELTNWLNYARGGGRTVKTAADKISRKSVKWFNNFYHFKVNGENFDYKQSGANGAAMRILPIALANLGNAEKIKEEIFCNSIVTHGHPRAILGAMLYGYAVNQIIVIRPEDFNWENYLTQIGLDFPKKFELSFTNKIEVREWLKTWNKSSNKTFESTYIETITETQNQLRFIYQSIKQNLPVHDTLNKIGCFDPATKGSGIATVIAGIYLATKFKDEPLLAITESVNALGSDTDSIAAFTGGLIGALHGQSIIPDKWKSVQDIEYLDKIAERLLKISEDRLTDEIEESNEGLKILNDPKVDNFQINEDIEFFPLGKGKIISIDRQSTLTKGKYNLIIETELNIGQTIIVSKLFPFESEQQSASDSIDSKDILINQATEKLRPKALEKFKTFVNQQTKISKSLMDTLITILKNDE
jgi:ADP-ribosylglycohydrolase